MSANPDLVGARPGAEPGARGGPPPVDGEVTVVVPTRNRAELVRDCVASILTGERLPAEIVVVDQSTDDPPALPAGQRGCEVRHVRTGEAGLSRARNLGVREARGTIIAFVDDDMWVDPGWLSALADGLRAHGPGHVVTGSVLEAEDTGSFAPSTTPIRDARVYRGALWSDPLYGGNMAAFARTFADVGGFDPRLGAGTRLPGAEDNDFGFRLLRRGYGIAVIPDAIVHHRAWRRADEATALQRAYGLGQGAFYAKHIGHPVIVGRAARSVLRSAIRIPQVALRSPRRASEEPAYLLGLLQGAGRWVARESRRETEAS